MGRSVCELVDAGDVEMSPRVVTITQLRPVDVEERTLLGRGAAFLDDALGGRMPITWFAPVEASFLGKLYGTR